MILSIFVESAMKCPMVVSSGKCKLTFRERVVWSVILWRNRVNQACSVYYVNRVCGIDYRTVAKVVDRLLELKLVERETRRNLLTGIEPVGETRDWFSWKDSKEGWLKRLRYWRMDFGTGLPLNTAGVLCMVRSLWEARTFKNPKLELLKTSARGVASLLGVSIRCVRSAFKRLQAEGMLTAKSSRNGYDIVLAPIGADTILQSSLETKLNPKVIKVNMCGTTSSVQSDPCERERRLVEDTVGRLGVRRLCDCGSGYKVGNWSVQKYGVENEKTNQFTTALDLNTSLEQWQWSCRWCAHEGREYPIIEVYKIAGAHRTYAAAKEPEYYEKQ